MHILIMMSWLIFAQPQSLSEYIEETAYSYDLAPSLVEAVIEAESNWDAEVISSCGATGLMQICPQYQTERMERLGITDLTDARQNILLGCDYLHELCEKYGNTEEALMFYNMGFRGIELYEQGIISQYAENVLERAYEFEQMRAEEGIKYGRDYYQQPRKCEMRFRGYQAEVE